MNKLLSVILSATLLLGCMFIAAGADTEMLLTENFYCGFENYSAQLTGQTVTDTFDNMSFNSNVAQIVGDSFVGENALKLSLGEKGITAFEIRNSASFELDKQEYSVTFAYKANNNAEVFLGMAKAGNVPDTAYEISKIPVQANENWQSVTLNFTADKSFDEGYVPAVMVYAEKETEIYFDDITIASVNGKAYVSMPEIDFDTAWYPTLKKPNSTQTEEEIKIWDGSVANNFAQGSGTESDPYLITNGAELALAITKSGTVQVTDPETAEVTMQQEEYYGSYYKITKDIYLNSTDAIDWANATGSQKGLNPWFTYYSYKSNITGESFAGVIDGGNHVVYGLYYYGSGTQNYRNHNISAGFIPKTDSNFSVKISNLGIDSAYFRHQYCASAFVGSCGNELTIENCFVGQNVGLSSVSVGAFVGTANQKKVTIINSYSLAKLHLPNAEDLRYGMVGFATQTKPLTIKNSYVVGAPLTSNTTTNVNTKYEFYNSYSTEENGTSTGTTSVLENVFVIEDVANMQGMDVLINQAKMPYLDGTAYTATNGYPELSSFVNEVDPETGKEIEIWDGNVATTFAKGSGALNDPYIISNGAELALAITSGGGNDQYFELSSDIYLNDITQINWFTGDVRKAYKNEGLNTWYGGTTTNFAGNFNGNGHTVYGIYRYEANALKEFNTNYKYGSGLFCSVSAGNTLNVTNLNVDCCYIYAECNASVFVGYALNGATLDFDKVSVGENVFIKGGQTGIFHAYAMKSNTINVNINNSYSLAELDCGFIGYPARTNTTIKNSFSANGTLVSGATQNTVTLENCYQSVDGNYTDGVTTLDISNMKGVDALTNASKMPLLNSSAFEAKNRTYDETEQLVFLPKGSIIKNAEFKSVYDNMCSYITATSAIVDNILIKDAYIQFADMSNIGEILVPAEQASLVRQGNRSDILKAGYYYDALSDRISKKVDTFGEKTVNYIFITDLHYEGTDRQDSSVQERAAMLRQVKFVVDWANRDDSIDFVVLGGDIIDGNNTKAKSLEYLNEILTPFLSCNKPVLAVLGNHDDNTYSGTFSIVRVISDKDWNDHVIDYIVNKDGDVAVQDSADPNSKHFYYDLESKKTRVICLDSCDYYNDTMKTETLPILIFVMKV